MMFTVYEKSSDKAVKVYNVRHDKSGYPHFLIYEDGQWKYKSAKHYRDTSEYVDRLYATFGKMMHDLDLKS